MTQNFSTIFPTATSSVTTALALAQVDMRAFQLSFAEQNASKYQGYNSIIDAFYDSTSIDVSNSPSYLFATGAVSSAAANTSSTLINVANPTQAISGGDTQSKANAFSGNLVNGAYWSSSQNSANQSGVAYIGQDFGVGNAFALTSIILTVSSNASNNLSSALLQYSDNGTTWTSNQTITLTTTASSTTTYAVTGTPGAHRYWRLLANANLAATFTWNVGNLVFLTSGFTKDISNSAQAISSGDNSTFVKGNAFDKSTATYWQPTQLGGETGISYIGQDFGVGNAYAPTLITFTSYSVTTNNLTVVRIDSSDNGTTWTTRQNWSLTTTVSTVTNIYMVYGLTPHRYWRIQANSNTTSGNGWNVPEVTMLISVPQYDNLDLQSLPFTSTITNPSNVRLCVQTDESSQLFNVATSAQAISGGDNSLFLKGNAFDGITSTAWESSQIGAGVSGVAWIGQDFGAGNAYQLTDIVLLTFNNATYNLPAASVQYSDDGTTWTTVVTQTNIPTTVSTYVTIIIPGTPGAHRYWRLLAASATTGNSAWQLFELYFNVNSQINTNLSANLSRDGGTTFTSNSLTYSETLADGTKLFDTGFFSLSTQPTGSSIVYNITGLNNNYTKLDGTLLQWSA